VEHLTRVGSSLGFEREEGGTLGKLTPGWLHWNREDVFWPTGFENFWTGQHHCRRPTSAGCRIKSKFLCYKMT